MPPTPRLSHMLRMGVFGLLGLYSAALLGLEFAYGQAFVRPFFTDIEGAVPFYAVNTTLSAFLLAGTGLLFAVCLLCLGRGTERRGDAAFYGSQVLFFLYLAADDRFKGHELVGKIAGVDDAFFLLALGGLEVVLLVGPGGLLRRPRRQRLTLAAASALFALMTIVDAFIPPDLVLRLSVEDLTKTWACALFFWFGWQTLDAEIGRLRAYVSTGDGTAAAPPALPTPMPYADPS